MVDDNTEAQEPAEQGPETPVCLRCMQPVEPTAHYCPNCGQATGQLTPYLPFEGIRWETQIWGQMWRQLWSRDVSIAGRLLRLLMIIWGAPVLLIGLFVRRRDKARERDPEEADQP